MLLFALIVFCLFVFSFWGKKEFSFTKDKMSPLRGILALCIVFHHLSYDVDNLYIKQFHSWGPVVVSIFFFVSGFGLMKSWDRKGKAYLSNFIRHRIVNSLLVPFIILWTIYAFFFFERIPQWKDLLLNLVCEGDTLIPNTWFVYTIFLMYLLFYISCKYLKSRYVLLGIFVGILFYVLLVYSLHYEQCWYVTVMAFFVGSLYAKYEDRLIRIYSIKWRRVSAYHFVFLLSLLIVAILVWNGDILSKVFAFCIIPYIIVLLALGINVEKLSNFRCFSWLSAISYEVYLCHGICINYITESKVFNFSELLFVIVSIMLTLVAAFGLYKLTSYFTL